MLAPPKPHHVDDRGKPVPPVRADARAIFGEDVSLRKSALVALARWWWVALTGLVLAWVLGFFIRDPKTFEKQFIETWPVTTALLLLIWLPGFAISVTAHMRARKTPPIATPIPSAMACLAAYRLCGVCAYKLHDIEPAADGCAACPECGAAWHKDRWVMQDRRPGDGSLALRSLSWGGAGGPHFTGDDRNIPLNGGEFRLARWLDYPGVDRRVARTISSKHRNDQDPLLIALLISVVAIWVAAVSSYRAHEEWALSVWAGAGNVPMLLTLFALCGIVLVVARFGPSTGKLRALILSHGLCPNCGLSFPRDATPQFDGCIVCTGCQRAWKAADVSWPG